MTRKMAFTKLCLFVYLWSCVIRTGNSEEDQIQLLLPPRPARIYTQAPAGVGVTVVRAVSKKPSNSSFTDCEFHYQLEQQEDYLHFKIDECNGSIETARQIEKKVGNYFHIVATVRRNVSDDVATMKLPIEVTSFNKKAPALAHRHYSQEILEVAPIGTLLISLNGTGGNEESSSKELYYFIRNLSNSGLNPWLYPARKPLKINHTTGEIKVSSPLFGLPNVLLFYIGVADGGSPQRSETSNLTVHIRNISAPRNLKTVSTSETSINLCWSPPVLGSPDGYRITYKASRGQSTAPWSKGVANITTEDLFKTGQAFHGYGVRRAKVTNVMGQLNLTNLTFCHSIEELQIFTLYVVKVTGWSSEGRLSMHSPSLSVVTKKRDCSDDLCNNGICQERRSDPGYVCKCVNGFSGQHCEDFDKCAEKGVTCKHGTCKWSNDSSPYCLCDDKYIGPHCEWLNPCEEFKCENGGTCNAVTAEDYSCKCPPLYTGYQCEIRLENVHKIFSENDVYCPHVKTNHEFGALEWPHTEIGKEAALRCPGLRISQGELSEELFEENRFSLMEMKKRINSKISDLNEEIRATRSCKKDNDGKPFWEEPIVTLCYFANEGNTTDGNMDIYEAKRLSHEVLTRSLNSMSISVNKKFSREKGRKIGKELSNLLKIDRTKIRSSKEFRQSARKILNVISKFTENIKLKIGETFEIREESMLVSTRLLRKINLPPEISFTPHVRMGQSEQDGFIKIPKSAVGDQFGEEIRFKFVSFKDDRIFVDSATKRSVNMPVFSMEVGNASIHNIDPPVTYSLVNNLANNSSATCVYWDDNDSSWSIEGLKTIVTSGRKVICESNHLTAFSVLLDPLNADIGNHSRILSIITYIGLALSTISLVITVATFLLFRTLRRDRSATIVVNLTIALLLMNLCFIFATTLPTSRGTCLLFAVLKHYSVACAFAWMLIEALNMHQLLVTVFPSVETHFFLKRLFFGWICPLFFVGVAISWDYRVYMTERADICVISSENAPSVYYTTYLAPMVIVLTVNCTVFALVMRVLYQTRPESIMSKDPTKKYSHKKIPVTLAQIRGAITVVALLGVTWISGAMAVGSARLIFQYIFCITTPLQGFVIFVVRVLHNDDARTAWYYFILYGVRGSHKLPPSSLHTHSSCQNTTSLNTQSTGSTQTISVLESALRAARRLSSAGTNYVAKNKSAMNHNRGLSSPTFQNITQSSSEVRNGLNIKDDFPCITKENNTNGHNQQLINSMKNTSMQLCEESNQLNDDQHELENCNEKTDSNILIEQNSETPIMKYETYRDFCFRPEIENRLERRLISSDLSNDVFSDVQSIQNRSLNTTHNEEVINVFDDALVKDSTRLKLNFNPGKTAIKVRSSGNLQSDRDEIQDFSPQMKSMSLYEIEKLETNAAPKSASTLNLLRFSSENTLDKIQNNDNSPLLGYDICTQNTYKKTRNENHSLNPD